MLKIKKSHMKDEWIVFNPHNFSACHTHCRHKRVAIKIKYLVEHRIVPQSKDKRFIESCMRVTKNKAYLRQLEEYRNMLD